MFPAECCWRPCITVTDGFEILSSTDVKSSGSAMRYLLVKDLFSGADDHEFVLNFHLHPDATTVNDNGWWRIANNGREVQMRLGCGDDFTVRRGRENPPFWMVFTGIWVP